MHHTITFNSISRPAGELTDNRHLPHEILTGDVHESLRYTKAATIRQISQEEYGVLGCPDRRFDR